MTAAGTAEVMLDGAVDALIAVYGRALAASILDQRASLMRRQIAHSHTQRVRSDEVASQPPPHR